MSELSDVVPPEQVLDRLRALAAEGHSAAEIAARMGMTRNAVLGRAHRAGIHIGQPRSQRRAVRPADGPRLVEPVRPSTAPLEAPFETVGRTPAPRGCRWIHGDVGERGFRWCDRPRLKGTAYCAEHGARVRGAEQPSGKPGAPASEGHGRIDPHEELPAA